MSTYSIVPAVPDAFSGESTFHQRVVEGLRGEGFAIEERVIRGQTRQEQRDSAMMALRDVPDGARVVLEGRVVPSLVYALPMQRGRLTTIATFHRPVYASAPRAQRPAVLAAERDGFVAIDRVLTTSLMGAMALGPLGVLPDQIGLVLPAVDPAPEARGHDGHRLLMVGRLVERKGHRAVLDALERVPRLSLTVVGSEAHDPEYAAALRAEVDRRGLGQRVQIVGVLDARALRGAHDAADLFVVADPNEAAGFAALQALAAGVPVLAAAVGGLPKTLPSRGVLWSEPGSVDGMVEVFERWASEPEARDFLTRAARAERPRLRRWNAVHREVIREVQLAEKMAAKRRGERDR